MRFSKNIRGLNGQVSYNFEKDKEDSITGLQINIYEEAKYYDDLALFELDGLDPNSQLEQIVKFVKFRIGITQIEIFKIGELLCRAKKVCIKNKIGYQNWVEQNFGFSYETSNNFVNVYKYCLGRVDVAKKINPSLLYKISKPKFPDELREYLFEKADFDELTNKKLALLKKKYEEGGLEAIEENLAEISRAELANRQMRHRFDLVENYLRHLYEIIKKYRGGNRGKEIVAFETQLDFIEPEAAEVSADLLFVIEEAYKMVDTAYNKAKGRHGEFISKAQELM